MTSSIGRTARCLVTSVILAALTLTTGQVAYAAGKGGGGSTTTTSSGSKTTTSTSTTKVGLVCTDTKNFSVQALHNTTFYVDPANGQTSQWVGYMVTFKAGTPAGASLTTPAGARLVQASGAGGLNLVLTKDDVSNYYTTYALLKDLGSGTNLSHVAIFQDSAGRKDVCTFTFAKVQSAGVDRSSAVSSVDTANQTVGAAIGVMYVNNDSRMVVTARGNTGVVGKGNVITLSPTPARTWPDSIAMTLVKVRWRVDAGQFYKDRLWFNAPAGRDSPYVAEYTFQTRAVGLAQWSVKPSVSITDNGANVHSPAGASGDFSVIQVPNTTFVAVQGLTFDLASSLSGGVAPFTWSVASGTLPTGLTLASSGRISGTPTAPGDSPFSLRVVDSANHSGVFAYTIRVTERGIVTNAPSMASADQDYTFGPIEARGFSGALKWQLSGMLPNGLAWNASTRTISGRVSANAQDSDFTVTVTDDKGSSASQRYTIQVSQNKLVVTPPSFDIPDLYLGNDAYGAWFDNDVADREANGFNYGYVSVFPAAKEGCTTDAAASAVPTVVTDGSGYLKANEASRWALIPVGALNIDLPNPMNIFCVQAKVSLRSIPDSGSAQAKDVRLLIDVKSAARKAAAAVNPNGNLRQGDLLWDLNPYQGTPSSATPGAPVCHVPSGGVQIHCRFGDMSVGPAGAAQSDTATVVLPLLLSDSVGFAQLRLEITTSSKEFDEVPTLESRDLRHPNNVSMFVLHNVAAEDLPAGGGTGSGGVNGNGGSNGGGSTDGSNGGGNSGNGGSNGGGSTGTGDSTGGTSSGSTGGSTGSTADGSGGSTPGGTSGSGSNYVDPSTSVTSTSPTTTTLPSTVTPTSIFVKVKLPSTSKGSTPAKIIDATKSMLPKTLIPLPTTDSTDAAIFNGGAGSAKASQSMLLKPGLPEGVVFYPATTTSGIIKAKIRLWQDSVGGLVVRSYNGWTGRLSSVPLLYKEKSGAWKQITFAVTFVPDTPTGQAFTLLASGKTLVTWKKSTSQSVKQYAVVENGRTLCQAKARLYSCVIPSALGPTSSPNLGIVAIGGDGTRSDAAVVAYAANFASQLTIRVSGSSLSLSDRSRLAELVTLIRTEGFTTVDVTGFVRDAASRTEARSLSSAVVAYLRSRLTAVSYTGTVNVTGTGTNGRLEISVR